MVVVVVVEGEARHGWKRRMRVERWVRVWPIRSWVDVCLGRELVWC